MNDGVSMQPGAWGQVRVREPAGERVLGETLAIGGTGSDVVVPGVEAGATLSVRRLRGVWLVQAAPGAAVRFNGRPLSTERDLRRDDVLSVGDAQVRVSDASRTLLRLSVEHLAGNVRSEEHTSELQSHHDLVCRLLLEKKKTKNTT